MKKCLYSHRTMEDMTDAEYKPVERIRKENFRISFLWKYRYLNMQSDIILLKVIFEIFHNICNEIYEFYSEYFFVGASINGVPEKHAWRKQKFLIDIYILLMVENSIRDRICNEIQWYVRTNNKYMKDYDTSKKFAYLMVCYECPMSQMLMTCGWFWIEKWQVYIWWTIHARIFKKNLSNINITLYILYNC